MKHQLRISVLVLCLVTSWGLARADVAPATSDTSDNVLQQVEDSIPINEITQPVWWFNWGLDTRFRGEYYENNTDLNSGANDARNLTRWRTRVWTEFGPFLKDSNLSADNGLKIYFRAVYEPKYYQSGTHNVAETRQWNEIALDSLYVNWVRMGGLPMALKVGRQDIVYGKGWITGDGTPADGGRTVYNDAVKVSLFFDAANQLDLFAIDNKGNPRVDPINDEHRPTGEYDAKLLGAYLISTYFKPTELNIYGIYKDETRESKSGNTLPGTRTVITVGALAQGKWATDSNFDYYVEVAGQGGREAGADRGAWGLNSELGYTFAKCDWKPRLRAFYEFLSGDDPGTRQYEGWDPVLGRYPQWSEIFANRYRAEGGLGANYSNLRRMGIGVKLMPNTRTTVMFDYSYLLANHHQFGTDGNFGSDMTRGHLFAGKVFYNFTDRLSGHLWAEYLNPGNYYGSDSQNACFLRWEIAYAFKPVVHR